MRLRKRPWGDVILKENKDFVINALDLESEVFLNFIKKDNLVLEIGTGKGDFILEMAQKYPNKNFIGVELQGMALAIATKKIVSLKPSNLLLINADIALLFPLLPENKFDTVFLNFSDPWPKKRQHKRRLTYPTFLEAYKKILKDGGEVIFKTDNDLLFEDSCAYLENSDLKVVKIDYNYDSFDPYDAQTEYETKFRNLGVKIKRYIAKKEENSDVK